MNFLAKWGKKLLWMGISSFVLTFIADMCGITFLDDLGGNLINLGLIVAGIAGIYMDKNLNGINKVNNEELSLKMTQALLEEKKLKKIEGWDKTIISDYIRQILENNKFSIWINKSKITVGEEDNKNVYIKIFFAGKDELIDSRQEITLRDGKKFIQNKHELTTKKEYSEKVFLCAYNLIEELFEKLLKLNSLEIKIYLPENNFLILDVNSTRQQLLQLKSTNIEYNIDKLNFFNAVYNFDKKSFEFKEVTV